MLHTRYLRLVSFLVCFALIVVWTGYGVESEGTDEQPLRGLVPIPILGYTPELGAMFGIMLYLYSTPRPISAPDLTDSISTNALYTTTGAYSTALFLDRYTRNGGAKIETGVVFQEVPQAFYGLGKDSGKLEEGYTGNAVQLSGTLLFDAGRNTRMGPSYRFGRYWVSRTEPDGTLEMNEIAGANGTVVSELGARLVRDTRPGLLDPGHGTYLGIGAAASRGPIGSEYEYNRFQFDARRVIPIYRGHRLVIRGLYEVVTDEAPFQVMPALGGETLLRGLLGGYYSDRTLMAIQSEYRIPLPGRFGAVVFSEVGQTAPTPGEFRLDGNVVTGGGGLRYELDSNQRFNIRLDFGYSEEGGLLVYLGAMEAF